MLDSSTTTDLSDPTFMLNSADSSVYVPPEVGIEIWVGSIAALIPIIWATYEFTSRIRVQQQCLVCNGSGLVNITKSGVKLSRLRKCWSCGGFIPWLGWKMFFFSSFLDVGNGGVLQRPSPDYQKANELIAKKLIEEKSKPVDASIIDDQPLL
eukprot:gene9062-12222_t